MATTFEVDEVELGQRRLGGGPMTTVLDEYFGERGHGKLEAASALPGGVYRPKVHPFVGALATAYDEHLPLVLSPDHVWTVLAQGFATHVKLNAEALRHQFVAHQGQINLEVIRDDFVLGGDNPWPEVFGAWSQKLREHLGKRHDLVVADFRRPARSSRPSASWC